MQSYPLANIETQRYYHNEPKLNGFLLKKKLYLKQRIGYT